MRLKTFATATAMLALGTGLAFADCPDRSASAQQPGATGAAGAQGTGSAQGAGSGRIAKDGSTAPLQQQPGSAGAGTTGSASANQGSGTTAAASGSMGSGSTTSGSTASGTAGSGSSASGSMGTGSSTTAMNNQGGASGSGSGNQQGGVSKDGSTMPLAPNRGGGDTNRAMSGQDVQAQQQGQPTAQAKATDC